MYVYIENEKINGKGIVKLLGENIINLEVNEEIYNNHEKYIYKNGEIIFNENYEAEQELIKKEEIKKLSLTRGDVFRGLLQAKGIKRTQIRSLIENNESLSEENKEMALIDFDEALHFYRGNNLITALGETLGINSKQLDNFFMTNDYTKLTKIENDNLV